MSGVSKISSCQNSKTKAIDSNKDAEPGSQLWTDGLVCAFEFIRVPKKSVTPKSFSNGKSSHRSDDVNLKNQMHSDGGTEPNSQRLPGNPLLESEPLIELESHQGSCMDGHKSASGRLPAIERCERSCWVPIGWARISDLVQTVQVDAEWSTQPIEFLDGEDDITVAELAAPYWERPVGPTWWCHLSAGHPHVEAWLNAAHWLHPAIRTALRDESRLISDRMKHLLYEVYFLSNIYNFLAEIILKDYLAINH